MTGNQAAESLIGRTFKGYRVVRFIARGGMGLVFEGIQESLDRAVVLKILYPHLSDDGQFRERFEREARAVARLDHPNIVRVIDFGTEDSMHFMVLDFIDGVSLRDRLRRVHADGLTLRTETVIGILDQVGAALTYAHGQGYVHRDVKPGNILLANNGRVFLTDFGVVKLVDSAQATATGSVIGTPEYMAPEQASGANVGPSADLYALAIVTYEMLIGRVPFQAAQSIAVLHKHLNEPPPPPSTIVPWYPPDLDAVFARALAKHPNDRYPNATEFIHALISGLHADRGSHPLTPTGQIPGASTLASPSWTPTPTPVPPGPMTPTGAGMASPGAGMTQQPAASMTQYPTAIGVPPQSTGTGMTPQPTGTGMTPIPPGATPPPPLPPAGATPLPEPSDRGRTPIIAAVLVAALLLLGIGAAFALTRGGDDDDDLGGTGTNGTATATAESPAETPTAAEATKTAAEEPTKTAEVVVGETPTDVAGAETPSVVEETATATAEPAQEPIIVFTSHRGGIHDSQVYVMKVDGEEERKLVDTRGHSWGPRLSPDGTLLFFSSVAPGEHQSHDAAGGGTTGSGNHDIYVNDVTGSTAADLTLTLRGNITAGQTTWDNGWAWSPDGQWITFTSDRDGGNWDIFKMAPDGSDVHRVTDHSAQDGWPSWTPDGRIVFASDRTGNWEIFIMDEDGSNVQQLTDLPNTVDLYPSVSPDGTKVVFSSQIASVNEGQIFVMPIEGGEPTPLTNTAALNNMPSWCPSGEQIVFTSDREGNENIYLMNADGTGQIALTDDPGEDTTPICVAPNPKP